MKNRRAFLAKLAFGSIGVTLAATARGDAQSASPPPTAPASPFIKPTDPPKPTSAVATALALTMRTFDKNLTDDQLAHVARSIDEYRGAGAALNPKKKRLRNDDAPVTVFTYGTGRAQ